MNLFRYTYILALVLLCSCTEALTDIITDEEKSPDLMTTSFQPMADVGFADIYEEELSSKAPRSIADVLGLVRYVIYNSSGAAVVESKLTAGEIENGFQVSLPSGEYRICILGEGKIVNYTQVGTISDDIRENISYKSVWLSANHRARKPVFRDYFFGQKDFRSGSSGQNPIVLKRSTGVFHVEIKDKSEGIIIKDVSLGVRQNEMHNQLHSDGSFSSSGQHTPTASEPYAMIHTLNYDRETGFFSGVYLPTITDGGSSDLTISYQKDSKMYIRKIAIPDFVIMSNKRTRLPIVIK